MNELYTGATQDAETLTALADALDNGQAFAAKICRKVAQLITDGNGAYLNLRYSEIQGVAVSCPETVEVINGLALVKLGNELAILKQSAQSNDDIPAAMEIGKTIINHPFTLAIIAQEHKDDVELGELRRDDTPGLRQEWHEHNQKRGQRRDPAQPKYGLQFVPARGAKQ